MATKIKNELVDELLKGADPKKVFSSEGLLTDIKKALAERMLNAEMDQHLESEATAGNGETAEPNANHRNGYGKKTVLTDTSQVELEIPRDRRGTFEPQLIAKYQRRFPGFDDKIISMYARGMSVRDIRGHLRELYGIDASPQLISTVTDAVLQESGSLSSGTFGSYSSCSFTETYSVTLDSPTALFLNIHLAFPDFGLFHGEASVTGLYSGTSTITYSVTGSGAATLAKIQVTINGTTLTFQ